MIINFLINLLDDILTLPLRPLYLLNLIFGNNLINISPLLQNNFVAKIVCFVTSTIIYVCIDSFFKKSFLQNIIFIDTIIQFICISIGYYSSYLQKTALLSLFLFFVNIMFSNIFYYLTNNKYINNHIYNSIYNHIDIVNLLIILYLNQVIRYNYVVNNNYTVNFPILLNIFSGLLCTFGLIPHEIKLIV